jgi:DNA-binding CsgD family transcriptional regulator
MADFSPPGSWPATTCSIYKWWLYTPLSGALLTLFLSIGCQSKHEGICVNLVMPARQPLKHDFIEKVKTWSDNAVNNKAVDWQDQLRVLSEVGDLITPELSLEELIAVIYSSVNQLMDAYQFSVGIFDDKEMTITFKGIIEDGKKIPDLVVDVSTPDRLAPLCILHDVEIFINDMDKDYKKYVKEIPKAYVGLSPQAALYVPLKMKDEVKGLITVRTIHKNVYHPHHVYILKTVGHFVTRYLALANEIAKPFIKTESAQKKWKWNAAENLSLTSKKLLSSLTPREKDVLFFMISGLSNKCIAEKLFVSPGTIKTHTLNIYQKMDVSNRTSAIMKAIELNWFN